ncbi:MAG: hypothetical protein ACE5HS_00385 [bacterium]
MNKCVFLIQRFDNYWLKILIFSLLAVCLLTQTAQSQSTHTFPRIAVQHFGKAPPDWYARFDMVIVPRANASEARSIKALNPNCYVIFTDEWSSNTKGMKRRNQLPDAWLARDSKGNIIDLSWGKLIDMSILCPKVKGKAYYEDHPQWLVNYTDLSVFDGIGSDWCWGKPHGIKDIDLDRNGVNDFDEHGKNWVESKWLDGVLAFIANLRKHIGQDKLIWVNSGQFQRWGWEYANGLELERYSGILGWDFYIRTYKNFMKQAPKPQILLMDVRPWGSDNNLVRPTKNYLKLMRFMLTATLLGDGYFNFNPVEAGEHHYHSYYDEFDVNLGYPTSEALELSNGCWVRFYDNGVSITNPTGRTKVVDDGALRSVSGYDGPYYRFLGGQDPQFNNGQKFTSVELFGTSQRKGGQDLITGDGIILLREQKIVIADIIIDNLEFNTTPTQKPAKFVGNWQQVDQGRDYFAQNNRSRENWYPHAYINGGNGSQTATFKPNIRVPGEYEVLEWHGYIIENQMAQDVTYTIYHKNGQKVVKVDQSKNQGRWNSLGVYSFDNGQSGKVVISNKANGLVVADAITFRYNAGGKRVEVPAPPTGVKVEVSAN